MVPLTRRSLLAAGLGLPGLPAVTRPPGRPAAAGKLLVLGGTRFLGPPIVEAALAAGWEVTLFNRGRSNPGRFPAVELVTGDRDAGTLDGLAGRDFDAAIDTSGYAPLQVQQACELLRDHVAHYLFVSSVSVYPDQSAANVDESTATSTATPEQIAAAKTIRDGASNYGPMKAECERAAERAMPGRVTVVRPGLIVGPEDGSDRFTYWPARVARGGEVLAPGDRDAEVQFVDVRDLGVWCFDLAVRRAAGTFNAVGFRGRLSFAELLAGCKVGLNTDCSFTWVDDEFLREQRVVPYRDLPLWLPKGQRGHFDNSKALAAGLGLRSVAATIADTQAWQATRPADHRWRAGLGRERERELLAAWRARR
ncbi:MAG: NAD-dependent epimerase/dehydratase family protein [Planctomycetota bacterium]